MHRLGLFRSRSTRRSSKFLRTEHKSDPEDPPFGPAEDQSFFPLMWSTYINDEWLVVYQTLFALNILRGLPSTADNLRSALVRSVSDLDIRVYHFGIMTFVTDGGADIVKALEGLTRVHYLAHAINICKIFRCHWRSAAG